MGGGQEKLTVAPTSSVLSSSTATKTVHDTTQRITEWVPGKKVVWHVVDSHINFVKDRTEWNGTDIVFEIARKKGKTELRFTHVGLVPAFECYGGCSGAWGFYINDSLRSLITTGKGQPNQQEKGTGKRLRKDKGLGSK